MKDIYFVKYSFLNEGQPLTRVHCNANLEITKGTTDWYEFLNQLEYQDNLHGYTDIVIDFMLKVGETN